MTRTFRVGDRVRIVPNTTTQFVGPEALGKIGTIVQVDDTFVPYRISIPGMYDRWATRSNVEPAPVDPSVAADSATWTGRPSEAFKVGDRVTVIGPADRLFLGRSGVITHDDSSSRRRFRVCLDGTGYNTWRDAVDLSAEPVTPPAPAPRQAIVMATVGGKPAPARVPFVHADRAAAIKEAERLAVINPGQEFAVYERVATTIASAPALTTSEAA